MNMMGELWQIILSVITGLIGALVSAFSGIVEIFYIEGVDGGFTIFGQLLLIGLGMTLVFFAFRFIQSLIRK